VAAAQAADVVVAVVGDTLALIGEARSTATLELFGAQNALLEALAATGKPMVVVLLASKPQVLPPPRWAQRPSSMPSTQACAAARRWPS
jgi:beta-glucosidase